MWAWARERERGGGGGWEGGREGESESMRVFARTLASCVRMAHGHMPKWAHAQVQNNWRSNEEGDGGEEEEEEEEGEERPYRPCRRCESQSWGGQRGAF